MTWLTRWHFKWRLLVLMSVILAVGTISIGYAQTPTPQSGIDASSGLSYFQLSDPNWTFASIALRPDGQELAVGTDSGQIELYNSVLQHVHTLTGHTDVLWAMDWNSDGTKIASGGEDKTIRIWDANTLSTLLTIPQTAAIVAVAWSPDGSKLASIESEIVSWDSDANAYTDDTLHVWDMTAGGTQIVAVNLYNTASSVSWSLDGHQIAVGAGLTPNDNAILILDATTGSLVKRFPRAWSNIGSVS